MHDSIRTFITDVKNEMKEQGQPTPARRQFISVKNSKELLRTFFTDFYAEMGRDISSLVWLEEYDQVSQWLTDNKGKGLFLYGDYGRGKSILARWVLPAILLFSYRKVVKVIDACEINTTKEEAFKYKFMTLDDIGTEEIRYNFGNKTVVFSDIMDYVEKSGALVIITTNFTGAQIVEKYGARTMERILSCCHDIKFTGQTLRN